MDSRASKTPSRVMLVLGMALSAAFLFGDAQASYGRDECGCELKVETVFREETLDMSSDSGPNVFPVVSPPCPGGYEPISSACVITTIATGDQKQPFVIGEGFDATGVNLCTIGVSNNGPANVKVFSSLTCAKVE